MKEQRITLKLTIAFAALAAVIFAAGLVWGLVGLRTSVAMGGGSKMSISCQSKEDMENAQTKAEQVLKDKNISFSKSTNTNGSEFVVVFETHNINVAEDVSADVETAVAEIENASVSSFKQVKSAAKTEAWKIAVTTLGLMLAVCILIYFITKKWANVLAYLVGFASAGLAIFSLYVVCRIEFNNLSVFGFVVSQVLFSVLAVLVAYRTKLMKDSSASDVKNEFEISADVVKNNLIFELPAICVMFVAAVVCMIFAGKTGAHFGAGLALAVAVSTACAYFIFGDMRAFLQASFDMRYESKKSAPVAVSSQKPTAAKNTKQERPKALPKAKVVAKKRKRRNNSDKVVV